MSIPGPLILGKGPVPRFNSGRHLMDGDNINIIAGIVGSNESGKTAGIGGTRAAAYPIVAAFTQFTVVTSANDACVLPPSYPGCQCYIQNDDGANSLQVFANGSDKINATAGATGVALASGAAALYICTVAGVWRRFLSA